MSKERFVLQPSKEMQDGWVATDTENGIVLRFENHKFNDTVRCTPLLADGREPTAIELADCNQRACRLVARKSL